MGTVFLGFAVVLMVGIAVYLVVSLFRSIQEQRKSSGVRKIWKNFGLSIAFCILFFASWFAQGITEWQRYVDEQHDHGQPVQIEGFVTEFSQSTLENWQSEFLQLFSFVVLSALMIHHGSAESKDSDDRMEEALKRIEAKLDGKSS